MRISTRRLHALELLLALTYRVKGAATRDQLERLGIARAAVGRALRLGWVRWQRALAPIPRPICEPLLVCGAGGKHPDYAPLVSAAYRRRLIEPSLVTLLVATPKGAAMTGGFPWRDGRPGHWGHDLGTVEALIYYAERRPDEYGRVCGEVLYTVRHANVTPGYVPDLAVVGGDGRPGTLVEYAGASYRRTRFQEAWRSAWAAGCSLEVL